MPKCLVFCQMNYTAEILSAILTSKVYLSEVIGKIDSPQTDNHDRTDCLQFILELVSSFKQFQVQMAQIHKIRAAQLIDLIIVEFNFFSVVKGLFLSDLRVTGQLTPEFNEPHKRYTDKGVYDAILTQAIEIISFLIQIAPKETIKEILIHQQLGEQLSIHAYAAENEAVRQQIVELMRLIIDQASCPEL